MSTEPGEVVTMSMDDLVGAASRHRVEQVLEQAGRIVRASIKLDVRPVQIASRSEFAVDREWERRLGQLGLHVVESRSPETRRDFTIRGSVLLVFALTMAFGALRHSGIFGPAPELPSLPLLASLEALALFGAGYSFYRRALAALARRRLDLSVRIAGAGLTMFVIGAILALVSEAPMTAWAAWIALMAASVLTGGLFLARGLALWMLLLPRGGLAAMNRNRKI